jgi:hypothetical protein
LAIRLGLATLLLVVSAGCFWPVPRAEHAWPLVHGVLVRGDGAPAAGLVAGLTAGPDCRSARVDTRTDSLGRFAFDPRVVKKRVLIFPPFERFYNGFELCVAMDDGSLRPVYAGRVEIPASRPAAPDTISCVLLERAEPAAIGCVGRATHFELRERGPVRAPPESGWEGRYLIVVDHGVRWTTPPRAFIVWLHGDAGMRVAGVTEVPLIDRVAEVEVALEPNANGAICAWVRSTARAREWEWSPKREVVTFVLGPPGVARMVMEPSPVSCPTSRAILAR